MATAVYLSSISQQAKVLMLGKYVLPGVINTIYNLVLVVLNYVPIRPICIVNL